MKIVLATSNQGKLREFQERCHAQESGGISLEFVTQSAIGIPDAEETESTFLENALLKARHAAKESGLPALADDSGLCVSALGGAPGVYSARYAGTGVSADNIAKLLGTMEGLSGADRRAYFCCNLVFVLSHDDPNPLVFQGQWEGVILTDLHGEGGFGYDPVFYLPPLGKTAAELPLDFKNKISHRGQALQQFFLTAPGFIGLA